MVDFKTISKEEFLNYGERELGEALYSAQVDDIDQCSIKRHIEYFLDDYGGIGSFWIWDGRSHGMNVWNEDIKQVILESDSKEELENQINRYGSRLYNRQFNSFNFNGNIKYQFTGTYKDYNLNNHAVFMNFLEDITYMHRFIKGKEFEKKMKECEENLDLELRKNTKPWWKFW